MSKTGLQRIVDAFKVMKKYDSPILKNLIVKEAALGKITCEMPVENEHLNAQGTLHGGCTATIVDTISSLAFVTMDDGKAGVSIDINVSYLKAVQPGEVITIKSDVIKGVGTIRSATVDIFNEQQQVVASGRHSKFMK